MDNPAVLIGAVASGIVLVIGAIFAGVQKIAKEATKANEKSNDKFIEYMERRNGRVEVGMDKIANNLADVALNLSANLRATEKNTEVLQKISGKINGSRSRN